MWWLSLVIFFPPFYLRGFVLKRSLADFDGFVFRFLGSFDIFDVSMHVLPRLFLGAKNRGFVLEGERVSGSEGWQISL